jgi:reductive dehalogenase
VRRQSRNGILIHGRQLGLLPMEKLRRVEHPTTRITDNFQRVDEREHGFSRAFRGDYGFLAPRERERFITGSRLSAVMGKMNFHLAPLVDVEVADSKANIPEAPEILSRHIKRLGYFLRADIVGICHLPQYDVYSHDRNGNSVKLNHQFAIVVLVDQDYKKMNGSTGDDGISASQSMQGYTATAMIACMIADYIRILGFEARAHHAGNYQVVLPPLLLLAGIGELSRLGIVLNPFLGTRFKAAAITTDLPLVPDKPVDFGLQEFCRICQKCADNCPSKALPTGDTVMYNGYEVWRFDTEHCVKYRLTNPSVVMCGRCIKVCPWNKPQGWTHDVVRWLIKHAPFLDSFIVQMDDICSYGKQDIKDKWWFDKADVNASYHHPHN